MLFIIDLYCVQLYSMLLFPSLGPVKYVCLCLSIYHVFGADCCSFALQTYKQLLYLPLHPPVSLSDRICFDLPFDLTLFITPAALSSCTSPRQQQQHLSLLDRLAMHATQNSAAGLALRLGQICPVKLKPDTALLRAHISYSAKSGLWEALEQQAR